MALVMQRPTVIGVRGARAPAVVTAAPPTLRAEPRFAFEAAMFFGSCLALLLGAIVWWRDGGPGPGMVLLLPFWFCVTPLVALWGGHGLMTWNRNEMAWEQYAEDLRGFRARLMFGFDVVLTVALALMLLLCRMPG